MAQFMKRFAVVAGLLFLIPWAVWSQVGQFTGSYVTILPNRVSSPTPLVEVQQTGGVWQQIAPANPNRLRIVIENYLPDAQGVTTAESMFFLVSNTEPVGSPLTESVPFAFEIGTGGYYDASVSVVSTAAIWVWCATTGHRYVAVQF
jgi:hypothetical protein